MCNRDKEDASATDVIERMPVGAWIGILPVHLFMALAIALLAVLLVGWREVIAPILAGCAGSILSNDWNWAAKLWLVPLATRRAGAILSRREARAKAEGDS